MKRYVLGLVFSNGWTTVLLQRKTHPAWQRGLLNGIGGHVEADEIASDAMIREAFEETTLYETNPGAKWEHFATIEDPGVFSMACFRAFVPSVKDIRAMPGEELVEAVAVRDLADHKVIGNLRWLIPFALDEYVTLPQVFVERTRATAP